MLPLVAKAGPSLLLVTKAALPLPKVPVPRLPALLVVKKASPPLPKVQSFSWTPRQPHFDPQGTCCISGDGGRMLACMMTTTGDFGGSMISTIAPVARTIELIPIIVIIVSHPDALMRGITELAHHNACIALKPCICMHCHETLGLRL